MQNVSSPCTRFFLGTTTPAGFKGYFDQLAHDEGRTAYLIKSGPGCGKSTLMKQLAEQAEADGDPVQRIYCSSDPDSLDGVVFPQHKAVIMDATAPHTLDPDAPGAEEQIVSLYHTIRSERLTPHSAEIKALFARNHQLRSRAARYLSSAGNLVLDSRRTAGCSTDFEKAERYAKHLAARLLPKTGRIGSEELRFLSGITPKGAILFEETVEALTERRIVFKDETGAAARMLLERLRTEALARGYRIITCPCALHPDDKIDHILIPELKLAFLTENSWHSFRLGGRQTVRCSRFQDLRHLNLYKARLRFNRKASAELMAQAVALMAQAKEIHDELEVFYRAAVDFEKVNRVKQETSLRLGLHPNDQTPA